MGSNGTGYGLQADSCGYGNGTSNFLTSGEIPSSSRRTLSK